MKTAVLLIIMPRSITCLYQYLDHYLICFYSLFLSIPHKFKLVGLNCLYLPICTVYVNHFVHLHGCPFIFNSYRSIRVSSAKHDTVPIIRYLIYVLWKEGTIALTLGVRQLMWQTPRVREHVHVVLNLR